MAIHSLLDSCGMMHLSKVIILALVLEQPKLIEMTVVMMILWLEKFFMISQ